MEQLFAVTPGIQAGASGTLAEAAINEAGSVAIAPLTTFIAPGTMTPVSVAGSAAAAAHGVLYQMMSGVANTWVTMWSQALQGVGMAIDMTDTASAMKLV